MSETTPRGIQATLFDYFQDTEYFDLQEANELLLEHQQRDINAESIRARIYEGIDKGLFERVGKGLYTVTRKDEQGRENTCLLINGDGRDLSMLPDASCDAVITDHPYQLTTSLRGRNRNFADYELFQYNEQDFREKLRVLKPGCFLVEFLPEENGDNYQYLFQVKDMARKAGFEYFARVPWKKGDFVSNAGRKAKNTEDICFFTKGRARALRTDAQKNKQYAASREIVEFHYHLPGSVTIHARDMGSIGTSYETRLKPIDVDIRISVDKADVTRAKELLETAFENAVLDFYDASPLDKNFGGSYTTTQLEAMPVQEYILKYLQACDLNFVDLSPGPPDLFSSESQVIVNPVNLAGVMGRGLALDFKEKYPEMFEEYAEKCKNGELAYGNLHLYKAEDHWILNFPTKVHWKDPSSLSLIEAGLQRFVHTYKDLGITSITFPKLGCGLGGLDWVKDVKPLMQKYLADLSDLHVQICGDTLREDKKEHFMSGAAGMLPTVFDVPGPSRKEKIHQAEKPVMLLEQILRFVTKEDELVLDQFAGSGALGEAALKNGRDSILVEKDLETYNKLCDRISALGRVEVYTEKQRAAVNVAIDALEAVRDGPEHMKAFAEYQNKNGMPLADAFHTLSDVPANPYREGEEDAIAAGQKAIEASDLQKELEREPGDSEKKILECSSRGDRRFSALYAKVTIKGREKSIEEWYQNAKRTADGRRAGKGKPFDHIICPFTGDKLPASEASWLYRGLWITYLKKHPDLVEYASQFDDFTDSFRNEKTVNCQADIIGAYVKGDRERYTAVVQCSDWYKNMVQRSREKTSTAHAALDHQIRTAAARTSTSSSALQMKIEDLEPSI